MAELLLQEMPVNRAVLKAQLRELAPLRSHSSSSTAFPSSAPGASAAASAPEAATDSETPSTPPQTGTIRSSSQVA